MNTTAPIPHSGVGFASLLAAVAALNAAHPAFAPVVQPVPQGAQR